MVSVGSGLAELGFGFGFVLLFFTWLREEQGMVRLQTGMRVSRDRDDT